MTTRISQYQKGKTSLDLNVAKDDRVLWCSDISRTICKQSAPRSRQITTPSPHHSIFYRPDAVPGAQLTVSKHWRQRQQQSLHYTNIKKLQFILMFTVIDQKPQKSLKRPYYTPLHRLNVNMIPSNSTFIMNFFVVFGLLLLTLDICAEHILAAPLYML